MEYPTIPEPKDMTNKEEKVKWKKRLWDQEVDRYGTRCATLEENKGALYAIVMDGVSKIIKSKLKSKTGYATADKTSNSMWLLGSLEDIMINFEEVKPKILVQRLVKTMTTERIESTCDEVTGKIFCLQAMYPKEEEIQSEDTLLIYKATADPDTMYLHQAMKGSDRANFLEAMSKEINDLLTNKTFKLVKRMEVLKGVKVLPTVWQMKRKRYIRTQKVKKWKARLNLDRSRMEKRVHFVIKHTPQYSVMELDLNATHLDRSSLMAHKTN